MGVTPRVGNSTNPSRTNVMLLPFSSGTAVSTGPDHQVSMRLNSPAVAMAASAPRPSLEAGQLVHEADGERCAVAVRLAGRDPAAVIHAGQMRAAGREYDREDRQRRS